MDGAQSEVPVQVEGRLASFLRGYAERRDRFLDGSLRDALGLTHDSNFGLRVMSDANEQILRGELDGGLNIYRAKAGAALALGRVLGSPAILVNSALRAAVRQAFDWSDGVTAADYQ